jgi:DNA helicase IV
MFGDRWQLEELTVNYRTPSQIAEAAARMANAAGLVVSAPKAVRDGRWDPIIDRVAAGQIVSKLVEVLPEELGAIEGGLLAVIADGPLLPEATAALRAVYGRRVGTGAGSYVQDIVVISPREAKGLEFDAVVVLEPSAMLNHEHGRVGDLYVAMTRPTQRLRLIAAAGVPAGIED